MSKIVPYGKRVVVKRDEVSEVSAGGLYLPPVATDKEKPRKGTVLSISEDSDGKIVVGDVIIFGKFAGLEVEHEDEHYLILKLEDVSGIVR
jgi:chaperonin GroES